MPATLGEVIDTLEADHDFLLEGDVFTPDLIETRIDLKRPHRDRPDRARPHSHEFELYCDL